MCDTLPNNRRIGLFLLSTFLLTCSFEGLAAKQLVKRSPMSHWGDKGRPSLCCKKTSPIIIRTEITSCVIKGKSDSCVPAVIFSTKNGQMFCSSPNAKWVRQIIKELAQKGRPCSQG
ncbi:C-C motif chemokine 24-like [Sardina pilchardus]|uniref:C-C motif chemokine 24-like n=1 Tax=Sardina pilchardus TaxID=27697 RepID=UPI002E1262A3